jgi:DNA-binding transcriptional regulator YhcF (GntR family)
MGQIIDMLKLDPGTVARIYESMRDDRFVMNREGEEIIMTVGPVECDSEGYADIALTAAEAIALAIRLIRHVSELLRA